MFKKGTLFVGSTFLILSWILLDLALYSPDVSIRDISTVQCLNDTLPLRSGSVECDGCLNNCERCFDLFKDIARRLDAAGIVWYPGHGTLLGLYRNCQLLPWDHDIDLHVPAEQFSLFGTMVLNPLMLYRLATAIDYAIQNSKPDHFAHFVKYGFGFVSIFNGGFKTVWGIPAQIYFGPVDVQFVRKLSDGTFFMSNEPEELWENMTGLDLGLCAFDYRDVKIRVPCFTEVYLARRYGQTWRIPTRTGVNPMSNYWVNAPVTTILPVLHRLCITCFILIIAGFTGDTALKIISDSMMATNINLVCFIWAATAICAAVGWPAFLSTGEDLSIGLLWPKTGSTFLQAALCFFGGAVSTDPLNRLRSKNAVKNNFCVLTLVALTGVAVFWDLQSMEHWRSCLVATCINTSHTFFLLFKYFQAHASAAPPTSEYKEV